MALIYILYQKLLFSLVSVNHSLPKYKVLSSAKSQISDCSNIVNISSINILNKIGPNIDAWGMPCLIFEHIP